MFTARFFLFLLRFSFRLERIVIIMLISYNNIMFNRMIALYVCGGTTFGFKPITHARRLTTDLFIKILHANPLRKCLLINRSVLLRAK